MAIGVAVLPPIYTCQLNMSQCEVTEQNDRFVVNVYNSLARNGTKYVRVPVKDGTALEVLDPRGKVILLLFL